MDNPAASIMIGDTAMITVYSALLTEVRPKRALDAGMVLKRTGALSRSFRGAAISEDTVLFGIDIAENLTAPVYETLYEKTAGKDGYETAFSGMHFELALLLDLRRVMEREEYKKLAGWCLRVSDLLLTDDSGVAGNCAASVFNLEGRDFYLCSR